MADDRYLQNRQLAYDLLKQEGYTDIGDSAEELFKNKANAELAYKLLSEAGYTDIGKDYDEFAGMLYAPATPSRPTAGSGQVEQPKRKPDPQAVAEGRAMFEANRPVQGPGWEAVAESQPYRPEPVVEQVVDPQERQTLVDNVAQAYAQNKPIIDEYEARWNEYQADTDNELSGPDVDAKKAWLDEHNQEYRNAKEAISEAEGRLNLYDKPKDMERLSEKRSEVRKHKDPTTIIARGITPFGRDNTGKPSKVAKEYSEYNVADDLYSMAEQTLNQGSKYDPGYEGGWADKLWTAVRQFGEGAANNFDKGSLTFGLSEGNALTTARKVGDKYNKIIDDTIKSLGYSEEDITKLIDSINNGGEGAEKYLSIMSSIEDAVAKGLSDGEKSILDALEEYLSAQMKRSQDVSVASAAGAGAEQSAEFMLDFILTGGLTKGATKAAAKLASKRLMRKLGEKGAKAVSTALTDAGVAAARTAIMFPRSLQSYGENLTQMTGTDELGRYQFDRSHLNAALNTALTQYIEYWSEGFGEYFAAGERAIFKNVTKAAPRTAIGKTLNQYRGNIGKYLDYGKFDGMFNEMVEEVVGSSFNALAGWMSNDRIGDKEAMKDFFSGEQLATLALSFLPMSAISAGTNIKAYNKMKNRYNEGVKMLNPFIERGVVSREELEALTSTISEKTPEEIKDAMVEITDKARKANGGYLPEDFTQNLLGYVEGSFAMSLNNETWENSQEKMGVVNAYEEQYANPDDRSAWDLSQLEAQAREAAIQVGFDENTLELDSYMLAKQAQALRETNPQQADVLMGYATAKAANQGLKDGYDEETSSIFDNYENDVRQNINVNGNVISAIGANGMPVFISSNDVTVNADGTLSTPTGADGLVSYRVTASAAPQQAKASTFRSAQVQDLETFMLDQEDSFFDQRLEIFDSAKSTIPPMRAIEQRMGQTVYVEGNGAFEPVVIQRITSDGEVVISGDKEALKGIALSANIASPGGQNLKLPALSLYNILSKEADGTLTTDQPQEQPQAQSAAVPERPASEPEVVNPILTPENSIGEDTEVILDGNRRTVTILDVSDGKVYYEFEDENGDTQTRYLPYNEFMTAQDRAANPGRYENAPVVEETPATEPEEAPVEVAETAESEIPVDEKTGEPIYDAPGVTPEMAYDDIYSKLKEKNADAYVMEQYNSAQNALTKAQELVANGEQEKAAIDEWDKNPGEGLNAFLKRQSDAKAKVDERIADAQSNLPELQRKADFWDELREVAQENIAAREREAARQKLIDKYGVDTSGFDLTPQSVEEAVAEYLGNGEDLIDLDDAKKEVFGKSGRIPAELFRHAGNGGILTKQGGRTIADVASDIVGEYEDTLPIEQDAVRDLIIDYLARYTKTEMRDMIFNNRLDAALAELEQQNGASSEVEEDLPAAEEENIPAEEAVEEAPEGTAVPEVEEPVAEPAEPEAPSATETTKARVSTVQQYPSNLRSAYESGNAELIAAAEEAMLDYINYYDSILLLRGTENVVKDRRKKADKGTAEYKLQDFILKAIKNRIGQLDKAAVKAYDDARAVYEDRFTAEKDALESAIEYFQGEQEAAKTLLENVQDGMDELYVANIKKRVSSAKRYIDALEQELKRFDDETQETDEPEATENITDVVNETPQNTPQSVTASESETTRVVKPQVDGKIDDFGEKIGGARKDTYRAKIRDAVKLTAKDLSTLKDPDKILPRKKIISLMNEGQMTNEDAQTLLALNMAVRGASDSFGLKTLALTKYRDLAAAWESGKDLSVEITDQDIDFLVSQYSERLQQTPNFREKTRASAEALLMKVFNDYKATYEAINYPAVNRAIKSAYIRPGSADGRFWVVGGPSSYRGWPFATIEQAAVKMEAEYPEIKQEEGKSGNTDEGGEKDKIGNLSVTKDESGWYRIKSRSIPGKIYLSKKFYSKREAEQFLKDNAIALADREQKMVDALLGSNIGMVNREGIDYRNGKDVTPDQMLETFGFRGVEFGNWVPQAERQEYLNKTYDAIMDFCSIVGISPKAFSLGGRLGLAFGARGHSRALAHYEPMKEVINLTRMKGAGSLAHEWFHALDNYLAKQKTGNISDMATSTKNVVRDELAQVFRDFVGAMDRLDYSKRSHRAGDYWGEVWERAARLFESYVYNELASKSVVSPLLVRKDTLFDDVQSEENSASSWPYPSIAENEQMKPLFDNLFKTIEEKVQEDGKVGLYKDVSSNISEDELNDVSLLPMNDVTSTNGDIIKGVNTLLNEVNAQIQERQNNGEDATDLLQRKAEIQQEVDGRRRKIEEWREEYHITEDGVISQDELVRFFKDHNQSEENLLLLEKVLPVISKIGLRFRFTQEAKQAGETSLNGNVRFLEDYLAASGVSKDTIATTVLHEMIHGATMSVLEAYARGGKLRSDLTASQQEAAKEILDIFDELKKYEAEHRNEVEEAGTDYGFTSPHEMVAEMSNPVFRDYLKNIPAQKKSLWDRFVSAIKRLFGIQTKEQTAEERLSKALDNLLDNFRRETFEATRGFWDFKLARPAFHGSRANFDSFDSSHMGEGEGAQAHGWGHYVALNRETAGGYANRLFDSDGRKSSIEDKLREIGEKKQAYVEKFVESNYSEEKEPLVMAVKKELANARERAKDAEEKYLEARRPYKEKYESGEYDAKQYWEAINLNDELIRLQAEHNEAQYQLHEAEIGYNYAILQAKNRLEDKAKETDEYNKLRKDEPRLWDLRRLSERAVRPKAFPLDESAEKVETILNAADFIGQYGWDVARELDKEPSFAYASDRMKAAVEYIKNSDKNDWYFARNLYTVDIPEDTGENYLDEDALVPEETLERVFNGLQEYRKTDDAVDLWLPDMNSVEDMKQNMDYNFYVPKDGITGQNLYAYLTKVFESKEDASKFLNSIGFVGIKYDGWQDGPCAVIFNDNDINVILHERFREETDEDVRARLDSEPTIPAFRAMQFVPDPNGDWDFDLGDGNGMQKGFLYPPMSAKVNGEWREPVRKGTWERSVEQPELVDNKGRFKLDKGNKKSVPAAYNPYFHSSDTMLNDQFAEAQSRDNLVVVEVQVPSREVSESNMNPYHAEKAKDAVGKHAWKAGPIQQQLSGTRNVYLSRWDKPVRIVPVTEVADNVAKMVKGQVKEMPSNVVWPQLRAELEKRGVQFVETDNQGKFVDGERKGKYYATEYKNTDKEVEKERKDQRKAEEARIAKLVEAERLATNKTLDTMSQEFGIQINRVGRSEMPAGHKSDKGYYDPATGEMTICMDNVTDERDAIATVLHETVGHHGLRKLLGDRFGDAMARIYNALDRKGKTWVNSYIARHPNADNTRAVEEYLSHLAESGDFKNTVWGKIKEIIGKIVDALFGTNGFLLTDNELNYILRASYENLKNPNWLNTVEGRAFDTLLKRQLGINETDPNRPTDPDGPGAGYLYRDGDTKTAAEGFDSDMKKGRFVRKMEFQDHVVPVRKAYEHVQNETGKKEIAEDEDYAMRQNQVSSRAFTELQIFKHRQFDPAMETVAEIIGKLLGIPKRKVGRIAMWLKGLVSGKPMNAEHRRAYKRISNYLYAVSGLERNASKNAEIEQAKQAKLADAAAAGITDPAKLAEIEKKYEDMKRDWSGLTGLFNLPAAQWQDAEKKAQEMIDEFKLAVNDDAMLDELWDRLRACTDYNLEHAYKYGLLTREEFERLHGTASQPRMWEYYLPLRGFEEKTAEEEYSYANLVNTQADPVVKKMKGRVTQSADPIANILKIAQAEIVQGNNNWAKQALWRFVLNAGKNSLLTQSEPWYQKDPATGTWTLAQPDDGESLEHFEEKMKKNKELEPDNYKKGRNGLRLNLIIANKANRNAHAIHVKVGGIEKIIWVNGDAVLAKAVNGNFGWNNKIVQMWRSLNRYLSQAATSWSLKFTDKNVWRDTQLSRIATMVDEGQAYLHQLEKNWWANSMYGAQMVPILRFMTAPVIKLVRDWENGTLIKKDSSELTERERMFVDFMTDGGATGYTVVQSMDDIKREVDRMIRNAGKGIGAFPLLGAYIKYASTLSEASELLTRFSVYQTSRQMGRSRQRSAYDAKETSVNFNRRGMQSGEGVWGWISAAMGLCYLFINPAIQSLDKFVRLHKSHPWRMGAVDAAFVMMGFTNSLLNSMLAGIADGGGDGDDDDKIGPDWYWNIPEWVRRSNMIIGSPLKKLGKWGYLVIPISLEYKGFYALGEMLSSIVQGKYADRDVSTITNDVVGLAAEMMPLNPIEGYTPGENIPQSIGRALTPDIVAPWVNIATNRNFAGIPLRRENIYDQTEPRAYGFYASTPKVLTDMCIKISEKTATWPVHVDIASGELRELLKGYGSGIYNYLEGFGKIAFADDEHPRRWSDLPYLSGLTGYLEEDRRDSFSDNVIRKYKQNSEDVVTRIRAASPNGLLNMDKVEKEMSTKQKEELLKVKDPEIIIYKYGDFLSKEANAAKILLGKDYILGREYYNETQAQTTGKKVYESGKNGRRYPTDQISRPALKDLRKDWMDARKKYIEMPDGKTEEEQAAKEKAKKAVQKAYLEYCKAERDIANTLLEEEYHNAQTRRKNGIPYEHKKTLGEKAYELTNK